MSPTPAVPASALERSTRILACPLCSGAFTLAEGSLRCGRGHSFDIARQGYASLTVGGGPHFQGDTTEMIAARDAHLGRGHYASIADAIVEASGLTPVTDEDRGWVVEIAGGTGYYAARILDAFPGMHGVTLDVSKHAARTAARAHPRLASVTGDAYATLPFATGGVDLVLSVFGPRRGGEVARILAPGGSVVVVTPRAAHLQEAREAFSLLAIGADKEARLREAMAPLELAASTEVEYVVELSPRDVVDSIMMGPNAFHRQHAEIEHLAAAHPEPFSTTISVTVSRFVA